MKDFEKDYLSELIEEDDELICSTDYLLDDREKANKCVEKLRNFGEGTFIKNIGGTTYDVSTHYNPNGRETALNQFKKLILSERLF